MSKFQEFMSNSKKLDFIAQKSNVETTKINYFQKYLSKVKSVAAISLLIPSVLYANQVESFDKNEQIKELISHFSNTTNYPLNTTSIIVSINDNKEGTFSTHNMGDIKSCKVSISINNEGDFKNENNTVIFGNKKMYQDMVLNHEIAHCITDKKFSYSGLSPNSEKWMNDWVVGEYVYNNNIKDIFEENFADSLGALMILEKNKFSPESIDFVKEWSSQRENISKQNEQNGTFFEGHTTHYAIDSIIENIETLKKVNPENYKKIADELASKSVLLMLNKNRLVEEDFIINDEGNIVSSGKTKKLGNQGYREVNKVINNYKVSVRNVSIKVLYDLKDEKEDIDNGIYEISKKGVVLSKAENFLIDNNNEVLILKTVDKKLESTYYDQLLSNYKEDHNYKEFIGEVGLRLNQPKPNIKLKNFHIEDDNPVVEQKVKNKTRFKY